MVTSQASENARGVITMMFYDMTAQYQAERVKSAAERRRADEQLGMMAAEVSRLWQRLSRPAQDPAWLPRPGVPGQPCMPGETISG